MGGGPPQKGLQLELVEPPLHGPASPWEKWLKSALFSANIPLGGDTQFDGLFHVKIGGNLKN